MKSVHAAWVLALSLVATAAEASPWVTPTEGVADGPTNPADAILGKWASPERESVVEVTKTEHGYVGIVVSAKSSAFVGKQIFRGVTYDATHGTWKGEVFAPKRDEYLPAAFDVKSDGTLSMTAGKGLRSKTVLWTRS